MVAAATNANQARAVGIENDLGLKALTVQSD